MLRALRNLWVRLWSQVCWTLCLLCTARAAGCPWVTWRSLLATDMGHVLSLGAVPGHSLGSQPSFRVNVTCVLVLQARHPAAEASPTRRSLSACRGHSLTDALACRTGSASPLCCLSSATRRWGVSVWGQAGSRLALRGVTAKSQPQGRAERSAWPVPGHLGIGAGPKAECLQAWLWPLLGTGAP